MLSTTIPCRYRCGATFSMDDDPELIVHHEDHCPPRGEPFRLTTRPVMSFRDGFRIAFQVVLLFLVGCLIALWIVRPTPPVQDLTPHHTPSYTDEATQDGAFHRGHGIGQ